MKNKKAERSSGNPEKVELSSLFEEESDAHINYRKFWKYISDNYFKQKLESVYPHVFMMLEKYSAYGKSF